jgi:hypothetical protein
MKLIAATNETRALKPKWCLKSPWPTTPIRARSLEGVPAWTCTSPSSPTAAPSARPFCCAAAWALQGEIRATGDVLVDQLVQMQRTASQRRAARRPGRRRMEQRQLERYAGFYQGDAVHTATPFCAHAPGPHERPHLQPVGPARRGAGTPKRLPDPVHAKPRKDSTRSWPKRQGLLRRPPCSSKPTPRHPGQQPGRRRHGHHPPHQQPGQLDIGIFVLETGALHPETLELLEPVDSRPPPRQ